MFKIFSILNKMSESYDRLKGIANDKIEKFSSFNENDTYIFPLYFILIAAILVLLINIF